MFDLAIVSRALEGPGQDAAEAAVDEVTRLVQGAEHRTAAERAAQSIGAGSTDVRLIAALLLGVFDERGPAALPAMLGALATAVGPRWGALRPSGRRERVADSALSMLFRGVKASMDYHESVRDEAWRAWSERVERDLAKGCAGAAAALDAAIAERIVAPRSAMELAGLRARTEQFLERMPASPPIAAAPAPQATPAPEPAPPAEEPPEEEEAHEAATPAEIPAGVRLIEVSPALERFIRKLEAFAELCERGEMGKAAIVAQDIKGAVERFDPRVYLPRLLTPYFRLLSANIDAIAPHWQGAESPAWQALEQLYQVDLEAFLEP